MYTIKDSTGYNFINQAGTLPRHHGSYFIIVLNRGKTNGALINGGEYCLRIKGPHGFIPAGKW